MTAWSTLWGSGVADIVIQNSYVDISKAVIEDKGSRIETSGRFSLGYPRKDGGEQMNAFINISKRPLADLRNAFELQDYPVDGLVSGWHEPAATHLAMLEAVAGRRPLVTAYREAWATGYRWHEFGDSHLLLPYAGR